MFSFAAHMCRFSGDKKYWMFSNSFSPWKSVIVKPLSCYLDLTCFRPDRISYFPLLFHACIDLKYISVIVFVCVFLLPPVCAVCLNNYIVVFQHHTGTALDLGFVRQLHLLWYPYCPTCINHFLYLLISPLYPTFPPIIMMCCRIPSIFHPPPTSSPSAKIRPPGCHFHLSPTILHGLNLRPEPCACFCRRFLHQSDPPLPPSAFD